MHRRSLKCAARTICLEATGCLRVCEWRGRSRALCLGVWFAPALQNKSLQVCPAREVSRLPLPTVTGRGELPVPFSISCKGPLIAACHCVPAGTAFLPAFQVGMCGLFSTQSYSQIMQFPLLCNCKEIFLEVLCLSAWSFSQNIFFFF